MGISRMKKKIYIDKVLLNIGMAVLFWNITGCALPRNPVPLEKMTEARIAGMPTNIRCWDFNCKPSLDQNSFASSDCSFLAISGGGANGAFGAGFLYGWSASGTRPNFRIVTGISTGALIAPLAFLSPKYDERLKTFYTTVRTRDIMRVQGLIGMGIGPLLFGESYASSQPLADMINQEIDKEVLKEVAEQYAKGRRLYIGTTNLDAQRLIIWDMGAIAASGNPDALNLFRKVMLASASIPGVFPPVYFNVETDGKKYDEMHVDGGTITEVFGYGSEFFEESAISGKMAAETCSIYVIRNGKLATETEQIPRKALKIISRSLDTLMKVHSWGDMYRLYFVAQRDKVGFNYVSIPDSYVAKGTEMFDPQEMIRLFNLGFEMAKSGYKWNKIPVGLRGSEDSSRTWTP